MPKKRNKKSVKKKSGFFAKIFDFFTALLILVIAAGAGYYFFFYESGDTVKKEIVMSERELSVKEITEEPVIQEFDPAADEEEMRRLHEYDPIIEQSEDYLDEITGSTRGNDHSATYDVENSFERSIDKWANEYEGYSIRLGADPDRGKATDNSHLMCAIWRNSAKDNRMNFKPGYMQTQEILKNIVTIHRNEVKNGDLIVLKNGMIGMVVGFRSINEHGLVYASETENKVIIVEHDRFRHYWLNPDNFKGYYRLQKQLIN